jgi:hypothetical protein
MPVLLKDFLASHKASDLTAPLLKKMHRTAPAVPDTLTSPHYSATYKQLPDLSSEQRFLGLSQMWGHFIKRIVL